MESLPSFVDERFMPGAIGRGLQLVSLCCVFPSSGMLDRTSVRYRLLAYANVKTRSVLLCVLALPGSSLLDIWS